jgi:glycosyltransferase involved in cell wall biosynthesis
MSVTTRTRTAARAAPPHPDLSRPARRRDHAPTVDIVVPVYNEAAVLETSIRRLHGYLATSMPFTWRIVIADNASVDRTWSIAERLTRELDGVDALRLRQKGRGRALRTAWSASRAEVLCYMDVDLSTDLSALLPLIAGLVSGHSEVAIGTRLAPGSRIVRSRKRELISRVYNRLLHIVLRARFSDAQCGFKALRADTARRLLPQVTDDGWFFDTELLIAAQRQGLRIHEVAVDWVEDPDSRVDIAATARGDLQGVARLALQPPLARFMLIGAGSTLVYALLYVVLRIWLGADASNALSLAFTAVANTQANRRYTFGLRGREGLLGQHAGAALVYLLALALTGGALGLLHALDRAPPRGLEVGVLVLATLFATVTRYVVLRTWVFARGPGGPSRLTPAGTNFRTK